MYMIGKLAELFDLLACAQYERHVDNMVLPTAAPGRMHCSQLARGVCIADSLRMCVIRCLRVCRDTRENQTRK
jgi:hypothetical protein